MQTADQEARRARRALVVAFALVLALAFGGCSDEFCRLSNEDPAGALAQGFLCLGTPPSLGEPTASFTIEPGRVENGAAVVLDASGSSDRDGRIVRYEWDVDGNPDVVAIQNRASLDFELDAGDQPVTQRQLFRRVAPPRSELRVIALRVTDDSGKVGEARHEITVFGDLVQPVAVFTVAPGRVVAGQSVLFDASGSTGADSFSWDLDADGTFEVVSSVATTSVVYATPGLRVVRLQIADAGGRTATTVRELAVLGAGATATASASRAPGRAFSARLADVSLPSRLGTPRRRGSQVIFPAVRARGRLIAPDRGLGPLRPFRRSRWVARLRLSADPRTGAARLSGLALATFNARAGRACLKLTMTTRTRGAPTGTLTLIGGTGDAAHLAGGGRFRFNARNGTPRLDGRLNATLGKPRPLPRRCSRLR